MRSISPRSYAPVLSGRRFADLVRLGFGAAAVASVSQVNNHIGAVRSFARSLGRASSVRCLAEDNFSPADDDDNYDCSR